MSHYHDRVKDTSTTTSTGAFTVSGTPPTGFVTFSSVYSVGDRVPYAIIHQTLNEWEVGEGTYSDTNEITRTTVHASSNSNAAVNFSAGTKDVFVNLDARILNKILTQGQAMALSTFQALP